MGKHLPQHVQMPNRNENDSITPKEQLIYVAIKRFMNKDTMEAFPSLAKLSEQTGASIPTIRDAIKVLVDLGYITIRTQGRKHVYKFDKYKNFEPFSYEFLDNKDLSFLEKSYLVASQQFMYKSSENASMSLTNRELSEKINMPESTISKCNRSLESKKYLTVVKNATRDLITGCRTDTKIFKINEFGQAVAWMILDHEDRITENTNDIQYLKKQNELLMRRIEELEEAQKPKTEVKL